MTHSPTPTTPSSSTVPPPRPPNEYDATVADTFPASDPPSQTQPSTAAPAVEPHAEPERLPRLVYRVVPREQVDEAFGVARNQRGGRWSSTGQPAVYASLSPAGAVLEFLAHLEGDAPEDLVLVTGQLPPGAVGTPDLLPPQWRERPYRDDVRAVGDTWLACKRSLALEVPSVLCEQVHNVLINPNHPDAGQVQIRAVDPFRIDPRLRY